MVRSFYLIALVGVLLLFAPAAQAGKIVVLTEKPVAEFTLPDGSVLTNAYVWKRSAEGIMIIHDGGQYYLNFKTLPDDWRKAYGVLDEIGQVRSEHEKRFDQYSIYPLLETIKGLSRFAVSYFETTRYKGHDADPELLTACALQAMLEGNRDTAYRLEGVVTNHFPKAAALDIASFYTPCPKCGSNGVIIIACPVCHGSGKCIKCGGTGKIKSDFRFKEGNELRSDTDDKNKQSYKKDETKKKSDKDDDKNKDENFGKGAESLHHTNTTPCPVCHGTGKCLRCKGTGKLSLVCPKCKGLGAILNADKVKKELSLYIKKLEAIRSGKPVPDDDVAAVSAAASTNSAATKN